MNFRSLFRLALGFSVAVLLVFRVPKAIDDWHYATSDNIDQAGLDTARILRSYESSGDPSEAVRWLIHGPSEAPGTQVNLVLGCWALSHRSQFVKLGETVPIHCRGWVAANLSSSFNQNELGHEFLVAFDAEKSPLTALICQQIQREAVVAWPQK